MKCLSNLMIDNIDSIDNIDMYIQLMFVICVMLWLFLGNQTSFLRKALGFIVSKVIFYFLYFISLLADVLHKWVFCCLLIYFAYLKILVDGPILVCLSTLLIWKYWWMAQISVDGPSVHLKFLQRVQDHREVREQPLLVDIGSCGLHTIHGAFKAGVQSTNWMLKEVLISAYHILHDSPAQRDDYQTVTESSIPLKFWQSLVNIFLESSSTNQRAFS